MAGIVRDLFLKLYLVILVSGKLALKGLYSLLYSTDLKLMLADHHAPILEEEERFFKEIYHAKNVCPKSANFEHFFDGLNTLKQEEADTFEGLLTLTECTNSLKQFQNNKTPGFDGFTIEFYWSFWNAISQIMVDSFNYAFENGDMAISQKRGIISLIPKKDKDKKIPQKLETNLPIEQRLQNCHKGVSFTLGKSVTHDY